MTHALTDLDGNGQQRDIGTLMERSLGSWLKLHLEEAAPGFTSVCRDQACCVSSFSLSMTSSNLASGLRCSRRFAYFFQRGCRPYTCALMLKCHAMLCRCRQCVLTSDAPCSSDSALRLPTVHRRLTPTCMQALASPEDKPHEHAM